MDIVENENELVVKIENGTLTLRGDRKAEEISEKSGWHRMEHSYGAFERAFTLPDSGAPEPVKADYKNETLTATLPKKEIAKPVR